MTRRDSWMWIAVVLWIVSGPQVDSARADELHSNALAKSGPVRFLTGPQQGDAFDIVQNYLQGHHEELGLIAADLENMVVSDRYTTKSPLR